MPSAGLQNVAADTALGRFCVQLPQSWVPFDTEDENDVLAWISTPRPESDNDVAMFTCREHGTTACSSGKSYALLFLSEFCETVEGFRLIEAEEMLINESMCYRIQYSWQQDTEFCISNCFVFNEDHNVLFVQLDCHANQVNRWTTIFKDIAKSFMLTHSTTEV